MKMPSHGSVLYDTRFFVEHFYSKDEVVLNRTKAEIDSEKRQRFVCVITLHEFYRLNLERSGRVVAKLRTSLITDAFSAIEVNQEIAIEAAELRKRYSCPMGDGLIAATARINDCACMTDDPHIRQMKEVKSGWIS
jgi:predicted nucleic acid-binding protein